MSKPEKLGKMVRYLEENREIDTALCLNEYRDEDGVVANESDMWLEYFKENNIFDGSALLRLCLLEGKNYYGNLESCMIRRETYINKMFLINALMPERREEKLFLMFECLFGMKVGIIQETLVTNVETNLNIIELKRKYDISKNLSGKILAHFGELNNQKWENPTIYGRMEDVNSKRHSLISERKKEITFFYTDIGEYFNLEPIACEAQKRGFQIKYTMQTPGRVELAKLMEL